MDCSTPGEAGVIAWCNGIRRTMLQDPGRQYIEERVQETLDWIDGYLEAVLAGPKSESMADLLKTPARKKVASVRAKASVKVKNTVLVSLEEHDDERENALPVNGFHKALLQAKDAPRTSPERALTPLQDKAQDTETVAHIPDETKAAPPVPVTQKLSPSREDPVVTIEDMSTRQHDSIGKDLSVIAEDEEPAERSRMSMSMVMPAVGLPPPEPVQQDVEMDESSHQDITSTSANTFHSIPLDSPAPSSSEPLIQITEPPLTLPSGLQDAMVEVEPVSVVQPSSVEMHVDELSVPIREDGASASSSKASLSQLGLQAPSPLHKSSKDVAGLAGPAVKRSSWLIKAREMKGIGKRTSTLGSGINAATLLGAKRKSGEIMAGPSGASAAPAPVAEERLQKMPKLADAEENAHTENGNQADVRIDVEAKPAAEPHTQPSWAPSTPPRSLPSLFAPTSTEDFTVPLRDDEQDELVHLKRATEDLRARVTKSMGKSLGGEVAAQLAEARAAAEARVAERHKAQDAVESSPEPEPACILAKPSTAVSGDKPNDKLASNDEERLSVSDLILAHEKSPMDPPQPSESIKSLKSQSSALAADASTSTTPPNSPPPRQASIAAPPPRVFSKPPAAPTVFAPPPPPAASTSQLSGSPKSGKDFSFKLPAFTLPAAMTLGVPAALPSSSNQKDRSLLSAQSSKASMFSDGIFDREDSRPTWMPETQDTDYSLHQSQSQQKGDDLDEDDSWHVDDKLNANMWTPIHFGSAAQQDDTWSTLPSRSTSQKGGDTGLITQGFTKLFNQNEGEERTGGVPVSGEFTFVPRAEQPEEADIADAAMEIDDTDEQEIEDDLEAIVLSGKATVGLVKASAEAPRSQSQQSIASTTSSSQSQAGFFGQATKLVNSVLGGSKKTKNEPVKSLQLAAQAAKKQQEEIEKKAARLRDMENRRQIAMQRKADEDKARALEEERKIKEENDRRKREREEHTDKRPLRTTTKKAEEDNTKKRKIVVEPEKPESKKPPSKDKKDNPPAPRIVKPGHSTAPGSAMKAGPPPKSALRQPTPSQDPPIKAAKTVKVTPSSSSLKTTAAKDKGKAPARPDDDDVQPAQLVQEQMANRIKIQMPPKQPPPVASESIELPEINSEYSDSEDEDRPRTFDPPSWAQSPELKQALQEQSTMNPDDIFGRVGPLKMEEIFKNARHSRFRARTSSANWEGADQLTAEEEREYARRMNFKS